MSATNIDRYAGSKIFSVFGQIEEVVAMAMIKEGKGHLIPLNRFPSADDCPDIWTNRWGERAKFAVQLSYHQELEFNRRIKELRK